MNMSFLFLQFLLKFKNIIKFCIYNNILIIKIKYYDKINNNNYLLSSYFLSCEMFSF